jgi:flagellar assembly protein FliH
MTPTAVIHASPTDTARSHRPVIFGPPLTDDERRAVLEAGFAEGRRAGLEEGRAEARAVAAVEIDALRTALAAMHRAATLLDDARAEAAQVTAAEVIQLAVQLAEAVIGRDLHDSAVPGLDALRRALDAAPPDRPATARLAPGDLEQIRRLAPDARIPDLAGVELVADPGLASGDCMVEAGDTLVDARVAPAMARLAAQLGVTA